MTYNLIVQTEAILDVQVAFEWYENLRIGLGFRLIQEIEVCFEKMTDNPNNYTLYNQKL